MSNAVQEIRAVLGPLDPATGAGPSATAEQRSAALTGILQAETGDGRRGHGSPFPTGPFPTGAAGRRRAGRLAVRLLAATAALVLLAGGGLAVFDSVWPGARAYAATPDLLRYQADPAAGPAAELLGRIADAAERSAAVPGDGDHQYTKTRSWYLWTRVDGQQVTSAVVPQVTEWWRGPDNSGRVVTRFGDPEFASAADRLRYLRAGLPWFDSKREVSDYGPGEFTAMWDGQHPPTGVDALTRWLAIGHPAENGPYETIVAVTDLRDQQVFGPALRAAVLRVLAGLPGLTYDGRTTDRAGRSGVAFSVESTNSGLPKRHTLVVDPDTGDLLGYEETLTSSAGRLNVRIPAVIGYVVYLESGMRPAPRR